MFLTQSLNSQPYNTFPTSDAVWNIVGDNCFTGAKYRIRYGFYGDTIVDSMLYVKVYALYDTTLINPKSDYLGAIREINKRVYVKFPGYPEMILYDFNLNIGDTIFYEYEGWPGGFQQFQHYLVMLDIDSVKLEDGKYRKQYHLAKDYAAPSFLTPEYLKK